MYIVDRRMGYLSRTAMLGMERFDVSSSRLRRLHCCLPFLLFVASHGGFQLVADYVQSVAIVVSAGDDLSGD